MQYKDRGLFFADGEGGSGGGGGILSGAGNAPAPGSSPPPGAEEGTPAPGGAPAAAPGGGGADWYSSLPTEIQNAAPVQRFKGKPVAEFAKSFLEAQSLVGGSVRIPKADSPLEEWNAFYAKVGRPEAPDKYEFKPPVIDSEAVEFDPSLVQSVQKFAHENGFTPKQFENFVKFVADNGVQADKEEIAAIEAGVEALRKDWGPKFQANVALAARAIHQYDPSGGLMKALAETGAENHPAIVKFFHERGRRLMEDGIIQGDSGGAFSKSAAQSKIDAIYADRTHPYFNKHHPKHQEAVEEMLSLREVVDNESIA